MTDRKLELLRFIGINNGLIGDLLDSMTASPNLETILSVLALYQENEQYHNEYEALVVKENIQLTNEIIALKTERGSN